MVHRALEDGHSRALVGQPLRLGDLAVGEEDLPIGEVRSPISMPGPTARPGVPFSTMKALIPSAPACGSTVANTITTSAIGAW